MRFPDLQITLDGVETCFLELPRVKSNNVIVACIYRHPHSDRKPEREITIFKQTRQRVYIAGDINQDFFQYSTDKLSSDYLDNAAGFFCRSQVTGLQVTGHRSQPKTSNAKTP